MKRVTMIAALTVLATLGGAISTPTQEPAQNNLKDRVDAAVAAAVKRLKWLQENNGVWKYDLARDEDKNMGCTALAGLALLEGGVPANDVHVSRAANYVRVSAPQLEGVYAMSLAIMFLDRYGGTAESYTIERLARRLVRSQVEGGWSYTWNDSGGSSPSTPGAISVTGAPPAGPGGGPIVIPDHSNTQFAILALWVARKHGADVNAALQSADRRFRSMQAKDGGWGYGTLPPGADKSTPAMTCAGLLGLALGHGAAVEKEAKLRAVGRPGAPPAAPRPPVEPKGGPDIADDPAVKAAVAFLAKQVGSEAADIPEWMYFLWSLERVCVAYKFKTIGQTDWYDWGARKLLQSQDGDGAWFSKYGVTVDTSWAILFLRRSDLVGNIRIAEIRTGKNQEPAKPAPGAAKPGEPVKPNEPARKSSPDDTAEVDASKLASALVYASEKRREELIAEYQSKPGVAHTLALAAAIKDLPASAQEKARAALAARLQRFSLATLERYLEDEDRELRLAAAIAARHKANRDAVPALIRALKDRDSAVVAAAHEALKTLTGQKFGRSPEPWVAWWKANGG